MNARAVLTSELSELHPIDLAHVRLDPQWSTSIPAADARRLRAIALCLVDGEVVVATSNAQVAAVHDFVAEQLNAPYQLYRAEEGALRKLFSRIYTSAHHAPREDTAHSGETIELCEDIQAAALLRGASDVHLVPEELVLHVRFRVDGVLEEYRQFPIRVHAGLVNRIKVLAGLDIAEKREPQDGRFTIPASRDLPRTDVRVASIPTRFGERMTLRLLCPLQENSLAALGMGETELEIFNKAIHAPNGLMLLTGPTGSGKSTTLFAAIRQLQQTRGGNIITVEDPIEYEIPGISQIEVDSSAKVSFARALRSILRHDPDVIMLGEIRDAETAELAIKAALTGHLVLSTLHTNTAAGAVTRLIDMGVEPFLVAATLRLAVAQRLVRKLCTQCRTPVALDTTQALALGQESLSGSTVYLPRGCTACAGKGYRGRVALFEMFRGGNDVSEMITNSVSEAKLIDHMRAAQQPLLLEDGIRKALSGTTTVQQVLSTVATW